MTSFSLHANVLHRLRNVQNAGTRRGGNQYNYRGGNMAMFRPVSEDDLSRDAEHGPLLERLNVLREVSLPPSGMSRQPLLLPIPTT